MIAATGDFVVMAATGVARLRASSRRMERERQGRRPTRGREFGGDAESVTEAGAAND